jgi:hypothetical protein
VSNIHESPVQKLRPTQMTVGMIEVKDKKKHLSSLKANEQRDYMRTHPIPAVIGAKGLLFITDHHHLCRAALEAGVATGFFEVEADFSNCDLATFWSEMDKKRWVHPLDECGTRHHYSAIPQRLGELIDDVYRSLAGYVRNACAYEKTPTAFAEFVWADFFRRSIPVEDVKADFAAAVRIAIPLAQSEAAMGLPGFRRSPSTPSKLS